MADTAVTKPCLPRWAFIDRAPTPARLPASSDFRLGVRVVREELIPPQTEHSILRPHRRVQGHPRDLRQPGHLRAGADEDATASGAAGQRLGTMREPDLGQAKSSEAAHGGEGQGPQ